MAPVPPCSACGASGELERSVLFDDETARSCLACGHVRVSVLSVEYSDNPHVDPRSVPHEVQLAPAALAWVSAFPRRVAGVERFLPASTRASHAAELAAIEAEAPATGTLGERLRGAGLPGAPPHGHLSQATVPFHVVHDVLAFSEQTPIDVVLGRAAWADSAAGSLPQALAREHLASRPRVLAETASSIAALRPAMIAAAVGAAGSTASAADREALAAAIAKLLGRTDPHSSDVAELRRSLRDLGR
jgi:hypothetical protein